MVDISIRTHNGRSSIISQSDSGLKWMANNFPEEVKPGQNFVSAVRLKELIPDIIEDMVRGGLVVESK